MVKKRYDPLKAVNMQTRMIATESLGVGLAFNLAGDNPVAINAARMGTSLSGMPSMVFGAGNVLKSMDYLYPNRKRRK